MNATSHKAVISSISRKPTCLQVLLILALLTTGLTLAPSAASAAAPRTLNIVAIGDSYTAGNGSGFYYDEACKRSDSNWSHRYANMRTTAGQPVNYTNRACSGSTTSTYFSGQNTSPDGTQSTSPGGEQQTALSSNTDMVLLTFGGNDIGFKEIVMQCFVFIEATASPNGCIKSVDTANQMLDDRSQNGVSYRLLNVLRSVRNHVRPDTQIVLMGYPALMAASCNAVVGGYPVAQVIKNLSARADVVEQQVIDQLNSETRNLNASFIRVSDTFANHGPAPKMPFPGCSQNTATWVLEWTTGTRYFDTWLHPNPSGQEAYSYLLLERFPKWTPASWAPTGGSTTSQPPVNKPPLAAFTYTRVDGSGNKVVLDGRSSVDPDGTISTWEWSTDGKTIAIGSNPVVGFVGRDNPQVTLKVTDNGPDGGQSSSLTKTLLLPNRAPAILRPNPVDGSVVGTNQPNLSATVSDLDGDNLTFNYRIVGNMVDRTSGPVKGGWSVPAYTLDPGETYNWTVTVDDGRGGTAAATRKLTVAMLPVASDVVATASGKGYWQVATDGGVFSYGDAQFYGSVPGIPLRLTNIIGMTRTPSGKGYWVVGRDGGVFSFGDAQFQGSLPGQSIVVDNIAGMVPTRTGRGYWLVGSDGGVFSFGDAQFYGSMGGKPLNASVEGIAATKTGKGYWLVARDGGIFSFGDAPFFGSMGGQPLNYPIIDMDVTPDGGGYWLTAEDGGVFTFGNAQFFGSMGGKTLNGHITGMAATPSGRGYWLNGCDGGIFTFGDAAFLGSNPTYMCRGTR